MASPLSNQRPGLCGGFCASAVDTRGGEVGVGAVKSGVVRRIRYPQKSSRQIIDCRSEYTRNLLVLSAETGARQSFMFEQTFKNIDDVLWKEAGCATELGYTEQTSWILLLKYLDDLVQANE
jgi:hypothetical protein